MPECNTRTYVEDNKYLRWNADDEITIFNGNSYNSHWRFASADGANSGKFTEISENGFVTGSPLNLTANYAIYPYNENITITEAGVISLTLPATQAYNHAYTNSFGTGANTMMAVTENTSDNFLAFKNLCGYLKLKFYGEDVMVKSVTIKGNNSEKIAGDAIITMSYGYEPIVTMSNNATNTITIDCGEGVALSNDSKNPTTFWVAIPEITFDGGITITITDTNDQTFTKSTTNAVPIVNNMIQPMAALEVKCLPSRPADNEIWYTTTDGKILSSITYDSRIISHTYKDNKGVIVFEKEITYINHSQFQGNSNLKSIIIPSSVITIWDLAFAECNNLSSIIIPMGLTAIKDSAFQNCESLTSITIPDSVTELGMTAFYCCTSLKSAIIGNGVERLDLGAFIGCTNLTDVTIGNNVTTIGQQAFEYCISLEHITIPNNITHIDEWAFKDCFSLKEVTIPGSVTYISGYAFENCTALTKAIFCDGACIGGFNNCTSLTDVVVGNGSTTITPDAFYNCTALTSITIPESITSIGYNAFANCTSLIKIYCKPTTPPFLGTHVFYNNSSNRIIYVPIESLHLYKSADDWRGYADRIFGDDFHE